ncbi:GcvT family protein [Paralimibaculum aggregatum]|nr:FAD-dependent oxidoreductase [Limibaculum sp. NKW23]
MRTTARAVVIGGGIGGCSALYHLTQEGWTDVMLLERDELTSGTTWHSAAQVTNFGAVQTMVGLKSHSIALYKELAEDPDYPINYHHADGGLRLASEPWHIEGYRHFMSVARGMGVEFELIDAEECARRHPLIVPGGLLGALWDPLDGDIDPAQLCQALARRARKAGAEVHRHTPVTGLTETADGWIVHTPKGDIHAEHVINAGGYRCNEVGAMMGVQLPVASMEHQYFLTEPLAGIEAFGRRVPLIRCPTDDFYARQEKQGLLVGFYEQDCRTWGLDGIDPGFTMALSPDDPDRVLPVLENVFERMPCLTETGIHTIINGPITYTPDGLPLVGRIPRRRNAWCITGLRAGLGEGGGHGWLLAQMMVHGEAVYDTWCLDPRRFGPWATVEFTALKAVEDYQNEFRFHRPHEHRPAGRRMRTTPLTPVLAAAGAEFGVVNGWERALYYKPAPDFTETHGFGFTETHDVVAREVETVRDRVGLAEVNGFNRIEIAGPGARDWLDGLVCGRLPKRTGRVGLCYALAETGCVKIEATVALMAEDRLLWGSAAAAELHDLDWLTERLPADGSITLRPLVDEMTILVVAGPKARALMASVSPRTDWSAEAFPWLAARRVFVGPVEVIALAVSFSGELAWELHVPNAGLLRVHDLLVEAGAPLGLGRFGNLAVESMRLEKGYRHWKADLITEFDPFESALERFVDLGKPDFPGKAALLARQAQGPRRRFVSFVVEDGAAPIHAGDSLMQGDRVVGTASSGGWGHRVGENIGMGFVEPALAAEGTVFEALILGRLVPVRVVAPCRYDPGNTRLRAG